MRLRITMLSTTLLVVLLGAAGCSGGGSNGGDGSAIAPIGGDVAADGPATLAKTLEAGEPFNLPEETSLRGRRYNVCLQQQECETRVIILGGGGQRWTGENQALDLSMGLVLFARDRGSDLLIRSTLRGDDAPLDYALFGVWGLSNQENAADLNLPIAIDDAGIVAGGLPTAAEDVRARAGSATYNGHTVAWLLGGDDLEAVLTGTFDATASFGKERVSVEMDLKNQDGAAWGRVTARDMPFSGAAYTGRAASSQGHDGRAKGGFFGPDAVETAGSYHLSGNGETVLGAFGGKRE